MVLILAGGGRDRRGLRGTVQSDSRVLISGSRCRVVDIGRVCGGEW